MPLAKFVRNRLFVQKTSKKAIKTAKNRLIVILEGVGPIFLLSPPAACILQCAHLKIQVAGATIQNYKATNFGCLFFFYCHPQLLAAKFVRNRAFG